MLWCASYYLDKQSEQRGKAFWRILNEKDKVEVTAQRKFQCITFSQVACEVKDCFFKNAAE